MHWAIFSESALANLVNSSPVDRARPNSATHTGTSGFASPREQVLSFKISPSGLRLAILMLTRGYSDLRVLLSSSIVNDPYNNISHLNKAILLLLLLYYCAEQVNSL